LLTPTSPRADALAAPLAFEATATALGGIFYLVNVALAMNLYPDFTRPGDPGPGVSIWKFIEELAVRFLDAPREDEVWSLLARLSRRDPSLPAGADFSLPEPWSLPAQWPEPAWSSAPASDASARTGSVGFSRFMAAVAPSVSQRLQSALGVPLAADVGRVVLEHSAHIHATDARVDVSFILAELPISIRVAGLDRDPGFLPTEGRSLHFHFT